MSFDRALSFITGVLGLTLDLNGTYKNLHESKPSEARLSLLNQIIRAFSYKVPFHNLTLMSKPLEERAKPNTEQLLERVLSGSGGLCFENNTSLKMILETLGFKVDHIVSRVLVPGNHIITTIRDVKSRGDVFLAEVGCGYPAFEAVPLDFESESPVYNDSYCSYKFVKTDGIFEGLPLYERWHQSNSTNLGPMDAATGRVIPEIDQRGGGWWRFLEFTLAPKPIEFFDVDMTKVYTVPGHNPFHTGLYLTCFPNGHGISFRNLTLYEEDLKTNKPNKTEFSFEEVDDFEELLASYFPMLRIFVRNAVNNLIMC